MSANTEFLAPQTRGRAFTMGGFVDEIATRYAQNEAIVFHDPLRGGERIVWRYEDVRAESRAVAKALIAAGAGKGTRVGILMGNRPEFVAAYFGAASIGAVAVTLSTLSTRHELKQLLVHADIAILLTQRSVARKPLFDDVLGLCPGAASAAPGAIASPELPFLRRVVVLQPPPEHGRLEDWNAFLGAGAAVDDALLAACMANVAASDEALILYTSGTTAQPKGILHNHRTATFQFRRHASTYGRSERTRIWSPFPLFWSAGMVTVLGATLAAGGCWVAHEVFEPKAALRLLEQEKVTEAYCFPTHTAALAEQPEWLATDLSALRCVAGNYEFASHPRTSPDPAWHQVAAYGMSETYTLAATHTAATPPAIQAASAGPPVPGMEVRIADPSSGQMLPPGEDGEICLRGAVLMERYVKMFREECFDADGFFHTGDLGFVDGQGWLHWTGRLKNMIKTGGANVSPGEVEAVAAQLPALKLCRLIGVPDPRLGEAAVLCAVVDDAASLSEAEVIAYLRARLASYKVPRAVLFFRSGDYPLTASGKVKDGELRTLVSERLAARQSTR